MSEKAKVLLTGVTGFLGAHTTIQLLNKGYHVTGTIRDNKKRQSIIRLIEEHTPNINNLKIVVADLMDEEIWEEVTKGMDYIMHIASPFPSKLPDDENELILPAKNGTLNILKAAAKNNVKRLILTSSSTAIIYGKPKNQRNRTFCEEDWTDETNLKDTTSYFRSKTIAEKVAWDFINKSNTNLELVTICPGLILGPPLETDYGTSTAFILKMMNGDIPATPQLGYETIDVRSAADLHILAMEKSIAAGHRFACSAGYITIEDIIKQLKEHYPQQQISTKLMSNSMVRLLAVFLKPLKRMLMDLGVERKLERTKARRMLGWQPIANHDAIFSCAESFMQLGLIKSPKKN